MAVMVPDSEEFLVLFEDGLFGFANLMAKAVASMLPRTADDDTKGWTFSIDERAWRARLHEDDTPIQRMGEALFAYLVKGHPHAAQPYLLSPDYMNLAAHLRTAMELFVMGHEWGHILSGDLDPSSVSRAQVGADVVEVVRLNYEKELRADSVGASLTLEANAQDGYDLAMGFWGIDLFFSCIDVVEKAVSLMRWGEIREFQSDSHPPTLMRRQFLRDALKQSVGDTKAQGAIELAQVSEAIVHHSFETIQPVFLGLRSRGSRLAPGWALEGGSV